MNAVEDVATAIAEQVRKSNWLMFVDLDNISFTTDEYARAFCILHCQDASQAKRLAEMMRAPPPRGVFDAMGIDPVDPLERFPSIRGKA